MLRARRSAAQVQQDVEIVGVLNQDGVECRLSPVVGADSGASQSKQEDQAWVAAGFLSQALDRGQRLRLLSRPVQGFRAQHSSFRLRIVDTRQVFESARSLAPT